MMREPNLNQWYAVAYRRLNQWARRLFFGFDTPMRQRLYDQKREIACQETLTIAEKVELARLNWILGNGGAYRFTAKQRELQAEMARRVIEQMRRDR